jgi:hypothetical protein
MVTALRAHWLTLAILLNTRRRSLPTTSIGIIEKSDLSEDVKSTAKYYRASRSMAA